MKPIHAMLLALTATFAATFTPLHAQFDPFADNGTGGGSDTEKTEISLVSEVSATTPGETFTVAIKLKHATGWHAYYKNPGGPGLPLEFEWNLPDGYELKKLHWPTPHLYSSGGIQFYVYEGEYSLLADISTPATAKPGDQAKITVTPSWQLCDDKGCDPPMSKEVSTSISIADKIQMAGDQAEFFKRARYENPIPTADAPWDLEIFEQGAKFLIQLTPTSEQAASLKEVYFMSSDEQTNGASPQKLSDEDGVFTLTVPKAREN